MDKQKQQMVVDDSQSEDQAVLLAAARSDGLGDKTLEALPEDLADLVEELDDAALQAILAAMVDQPPLQTNADPVSRSGGASLYREGALDKLDLLKSAVLPASAESEGSSLRFSPPDLQATNPVEPVLIERPPLSGSEMRVAAAEDRPVELDLFASISGAPSASLKLLAVQPPPGAKVTLLGGGNVLFTPGENQNGLAEVFFQAVDNFGREITHSVTVDISPVNDAPEAKDVDLGTTREDTSLTFSSEDLLASSSDVDGDNLNVKSVSVAAAHGRVSDNGDGTWTYTPAADYHGEDVPLSFTVSDGKATDEAVARLDVTPLNDTPVAEDDSIDGEEDSVITFNIAELLANDRDIDGDTIALQSFTQPNNGVLVDNGDGTLSFTPDPDWFGVATFDYVIGDGNGASDTGRTTINVTDVGETVIGTNRTDTLNASDSGDTLFGLRGNDRLRGGDGDDILVGGDGADNLDGRDGSDLYIWNARDDRDIISDSGASGEDVLLSKASRFQGLSNNFDGGGLEAIGYDSDDDNAANSDLPMSIEADHGNQRWDFSAIELLNEGTTIKTGRGNDRITASGTSSATYDGGTGNDRLTGGDQNDILLGGRNNDTLNGGAGNDVLVGGDGTDTVDGGEGADLYIWNAGDDQDNIADSGDNGEDILLARASRFQGLGNNFDGGGLESIGYDSDGDNRANSDESMSIEADRGNQSWDFSGVELLNDDTLVKTGRGNDNITASDHSAATYNGGTGRDTLTGGIQADTLIGGRHNDTLLGGAGEDLLDGGDGLDILDGGEGSDIYIWGAGDDPDSLNDSGAGLGDEDILLSQSSRFQGLAQNFDGGGLEAIGYDDDGDLSADADQAMTIEANNGNQNWDFSEIEFLNDDTLVKTGRGNDNITASEVSSGTYDGGNNNDTITGGGQADVLLGGNHNDTLSGGAGDDVLQGGRGLDMLRGGEGDDTLEGGTSADTFVWGEGDRGADVVLDFTVSGRNKDILDLSDLLTDDPIDLDSMLDFDGEYSPGDTLIRVYADGVPGVPDTTILLQGVDLTNGGTLEDDDVILQLLASGQLIV